MTTRGKTWSPAELAIICTAYEVLRRAELAGITLNKSELRRRVLPLLDNRSAGSYELKMCNISAALMAERAPTVRGYKPYGHAQKGIAAAYEQARGHYASMVDVHGYNAPAIVAQREKEAQ